MDYETALCMTDIDNLLPNFKDSPPLSLIMDLIPRVDLLGVSNSSFGIMDPVS
jgi:hypothetical protein